MLSDSEVELLCSIGDGAGKTSLNVIGAAGRGVLSEIGVLVGRALVAAVAVVVVVRDPVAGAAVAEVGRCGESGRRIKALHCSIDCVIVVKVVL